MRRFQYPTIIKPKKLVIILSYVFVVLPGNSFPFLSFAVTVDAEAGMTAHS